MGLFFKKTSKFDEEISTENKKRLREIFNDAVSEGESYRILYAGATDQAFRKGLIADTKATTFHNYIVGYRREDFQVKLKCFQKKPTRSSSTRFPCFGASGRISSAGTPASSL